MTDEAKRDEKIDAAIQCARDEYCNDDIEIDDLPATSRSDAGFWVQAWVFVHDEEIESLLALEAARRG